MFTDRYTSFTDVKRSPIGKLPLRDGINMTIEDLDKQSSGTRFMQFKSGCINWKNTQNQIKLPSAIYAANGNDR